MFAQFPEKSSPFVSYLPFVLCFLFKSPEVSFFELQRMPV